LNLPINLQVKSFSNLAIAALTAGYSKPPAGSPISLSPKSA
jgi:hypothetical protein